MKLVRAGVLTALSDGLFSSVLVTVFYGSTFAALWKGVASRLLGPGARDGGTSIVLVGLVLHICVAFGWSAVYLFGVSRVRWVRTLLHSRFGVVKVAAIYGPCVWLMMSLVIIPLIATHALPPITYRWWVQLIGHFPFVGIPIVWSIGRDA